MHVKVGEEVRLGLDAFIAIWEAIPAYRLLGRFAKLSGVHALLTLAMRFLRACGLGCHAGVRAPVKRRTLMPWGERASESWPTSEYTCPSSA
jgi:hypothetical protein